MELGSRGVCQTFQGKRARSACGSEAYMEMYKERRMACMVFGGEERPSQRCDKDAVDAEHGHWRHYPL